MATMSKLHFEIDQTIETYPVEETGYIVNCIRLKSPVLISCEESFVSLNGAFWVERRLSRPGDITIFLLTCYERQIGPH